MEFNKMFVILPLMLVSRKLDGEDPQTIHWLRVGYFTVQSIILVIAAYVYVQATAMSKVTSVVYVPPAPTVRII